MRKTFYTILVLLGLFSCSKDDVLSVVAPNAISFGNVFVDKSTKAPTDATYQNVTDLQSFKVYGTVTGAVEDEDGNASTINIFNNVPVNKSADGENVSWGYDLKYTQYWVPGCSYEFVALADAESVDTNDKGMPESINYTVAAQKDLLLAKPDILSEDVITDTYDTPVNFTFEHLLSKAMFTFTNKFSQESGVVLTVTDIMITNAPKTGKYNLLENKWIADEDNTETVCFGNTGSIQPSGGTGECGNVSLLVPGKHTLNVTFSVSHNKGGTPTELTAEIKDIELLKGNSYNFTADLSSANVTGAVPVSFTIITVDSFSPDNSGNSSDVNW